MSFEGVQPDRKWAEQEQDLVGQWILSRLETTVGEVAADLDQFRLANAASKVYNFFWGEFCDWYVEFLKPMIKESDQDQKSMLLGRTHYILDTCLRMLSPFMPFITEEIWQQLETRQEGEFLMTQCWPNVDQIWRNTQAETAVGLLKELITATRAVRKTNNLPGSARLSLTIECDDEKQKTLKTNRGIIASLAKIEKLIFNQTPPKATAALALDGMNAFVDMTEFLDVEAEVKKINRQLEKLRNEKQALDGRLNNKGFLAKAPAKVVEKAKTESNELERKIQTLADGISELEKLR
jgi:valyl-tRNA synthetase